MKMKKLLSLVSAAAISASCFAGMAVTASAADGDNYVDVQVKTASDITQNPILGVTSATWVSSHNDEHFSRYKYVFGGAEDSTTVKPEYISNAILGRNTVDGVDVTFTPKTTNDYQIYILSAEYNNRYFDLELNGTTIYSTSNDKRKLAENFGCAVLEYNIGKLNEGTEYNFKILKQSISFNGNSDPRNIYAVALVAVTSAEYEINLNDNEKNNSYLGGMLKCDVKKAAPGGTVTVTPVAYPGFAVSSVTMNDTELTKNEDNTYSFEMPSQKANVTADFTYTKNGSEIYYFGKANSVGAGTIFDSKIQKYKEITPYQKADRGIISLSYVAKGSTAIFDNIVLKDDTKQLASITLWQSSTNNTKLKYQFNDSTVYSQSEFTDSVKPGNVENGYTYYARTYKYDGTYEGNRLTIKFDTEDVDEENVSYLGNAWAIELNYEPIPVETTATAAAAGKTYTDADGKAAASFMTEAVTYTGTLKNAVWTVTATKNNVTNTAEVVVNDSNTVVTDAAVSFAILISDIDKDVTIDSASLSYTVVE